MFAGAHGNVPCWSNVQRIVGRLFPFWGYRRRDLRVGLGSYVSETNGASDIQTCRYVGHSDTQTSEGIYSREREAGSDPLWLSTGRSNHVGLPSDGYQPPLLTKLGAGRVALAVRPAGWRNHPLSGGGSVGQSRV